MEELMKILDKQKNEILDSSEQIFKAGNSNIYPVDFLVVAVNNRALSLVSAFKCLLKDDNYLSAISLIRLQLDNALRFFASTLVENTDEFIMHFLDGNEIRKYKDADGNKLTDIYLANKLDTYFLGTQKLYKELCGYVHLSSKHLYASYKKDKNFSQVQIGSFDVFTNFQKKRFVSNMIECTKLVIIIVEQWKFEKNELYQISKKNCT